MCENVLSKEQQIYLQEYGFGETLRSDYFKHSWVSNSIYIPISFGLIGLSYTKNLLYLNSLQLLPLALSSVFIYLISEGYSSRYAGYLQSIYKRQQEIEKKLGMNLHKKIDTDDPKGFCSLKTLKSVILVFLGIVWLARILITFFEMSLCLSVQ